MMDMSSKKPVYKKLWAMLSGSQRWAAVVLGVLMLLGMAFETLGIGMIIPALALMTDPEIMSPDSKFAPYIAYLGTSSRETLVIYGMYALLGVYTVKTLFLTFLAWRQSKFVYSLEASVSTRLFDGYLRQTYIYHIARNSAHLLRNPTALVAELVQVVQQGLLLMAEFFVLLGVSILLVSIEPFGAIIVVGILGVSGWLINKSIRNRVLVWGERRQHHENYRMQHLQQGLNGIKDVKLSGLERHFLKEFSHHSIESASASQLRTAFKAMPRLVLELLAVLGLVILVIVMLNTGKTIALLLPTLGLFAAAAFRLMPSVNRIITGFQALRFAEPVINTLHTEIQDIENCPDIDDQPAIAFTESISCQGVTFQYPEGQVPSLQDVSFDIRKGESIGLVGGSGAGKSTLVDVLTGLLQPESGHVFADGQNISQNIRGWQKQIGYVPQFIYLTDDTLRRNVAFGVPDHLIDDEAVRKALLAAQLEEYVNGLPEGLGSQVGDRGVRLSGGQRQRIGIARALYNDPPILVLDEATSSLDEATENGIIQAVAALHGEKTIIIVAHRLTTIQHCDRVLRLEKGKLIQEGDVATVLAAMPSHQSSALKAEIETENSH